MADQEPNPEEMIPAEYVLDALDKIHVKDPGTRLQALCDAFLIETVKPLRDQEGLTTKQALEQLSKTNPALIEAIRRLGEALGTSSVRQKSTNVIEEIEEFLRAKRSNTPDSM